jgi:alpha-amylase
MYQTRLATVLLLALGLGALPARSGDANPWNGKVVLQAFWWDCENENYPGDQGWYTYLAKLAPRLRDMGFDGIWLPPPSKGNSGRSSMGYDLYDHYDLGLKQQKARCGHASGTRTPCCD